MICNLESSAPANHRGREKGDVFHHRQKRLICDPDNRDRFLGQKGKMGPRPGGEVIASQRSQAPGGSVTRTEPRGAWGEPQAVFEISMELLNSNKTLEIKQIRSVTIESRVAAFKRS